MDFIIQHNMLSNDNLFKIKEAVADLPHKFVGLIPFSREITSNEPIVGLDHIPYGSTSFIDTTYELGWKGLSFDPVLFCYNKARNMRDDMLNGEYILLADQMLKYLQTLKQDDQVFMRPSRDLKLFSGAVYPVKEAVQLLIDASIEGTSYAYKIDPETLIVVNRPKNIVVEWRWFIVGGVVIDGSTYRRNGHLHKEHVLTLDSFKVKAQDLANKWLPAANCVMDTCLLDTGEIKVVEFNCINGSGFYDHDIKKIMTAWSKYYA